ncbi:MAG: flagellar basal body P-ring formation chaperone FlgA [Desulfovibrio sp.]|jgi:flagella basal body P-ring formation protein FlgA|nr:flagellar basal body P-ring formation chaperone FlgA [Desulfovibrio sp.]
MFGRLFLLALAAALPLAGTALAGTALAASGDETRVPWRIRFLEAAVVAGPAVLLGEVAVPVGDMPAATWRELAARELWPAPAQEKRPLNMTRPRLQEAVVRSMNDLAPYCLFPGSLALQRGGAVLTREQIRDSVENQLRPALAVLPGEASLNDFRLPPFIFLSHEAQTLEVEPPQKIAAGRLNIRLLIRELDGSVTQKISASVFADCWIEVPVATTVLNRDDVLEPGMITFVRKNLAHLRGEIWDGRGGPWRVLRPIGLEQAIYRADLGHLPAVRKGSLITLLYEGKSLRLRAPGEALADGVPGESIPVRNSQSRKQLYGIVRDASTVITGAPL